MKADVVLSQFNTFLSNFGSGWMYFVFIYRYTSMYVTLVSHVSQYVSILFLFQDLKCSHSYKLMYWRHETKTFCHIARNMQMWVTWIEDYVYLLILNQHNGSSNIFLLVYDIEVTPLLFVILRCRLIWYMYVPT